MRRNELPSRSGFRRSLSAVQAVRGCHLRRPARFVGAIADGAIYPNACSS